LVRLNVMWGQGTKNLQKRVRSRSGGPGGWNVVEQTQPSTSRRWMKKAHHPKVVGVQFLRFAWVSGRPLHPLRDLEEGDRSGVAEGFIIVELTVPPQGYTSSHCRAKEVPAPC
jgi:hypothetical protein